MRPNAFDALVGEPRFRKAITPSYGATNEQMFIILQKNPTKLANVGFFL